MMSSRTGYWRNPLGGAKYGGLGFVALLLLGGCDEAGQLNLGLPQSQAVTETAQKTPSTKIVERDVEAPEIFSATDQGLWDGRPSLGGVWVAHPDVIDPERVMIRNQDNGKFVVGALFRKERDLPGPTVQISSDAAAALNILAGAPAELNITALRREETEEILAVEEEMVLAEETDTTEGVEAPTEVASTSLDPIAAASAAIEAAPATAAEVATETAEAVEPQPVAEIPPDAIPAKPFIQIGIFSREGNANRAAKQINRAGIVPTVKRSEASGQPFWRVIVGPASSQAELETLTATIKAEGFKDAYTVAN